MFEAYEKVKKRSRDKSQKNFIKGFTENIGPKQTESKHTQSLQFDAFKPVIIAAAPLLAINVICGLFIGYFEGWSILTSFYFCFVTATSGKSLLYINSL